MHAAALSATLKGIEAHSVRVEVDLASGLPGMLIVGLPDAATREARERVRSALGNSGLPYPQRRTVVNLAPADLRKEGGVLDLAIALALLVAQAAVPPDSLAETMVLGELALSGEVSPVRGALNVAILAREAGIPRLMLPAGNAHEVGFLGGLDLIAVRTLAEATAFLRTGLRPPGPAAAGSGSDLNGTMDGTGHRTGLTPDLAAAAGVAATAAPIPDLADVRGQAEARRALEIAAAGGHNLLLTGPPGTGKSMLAERLPGLLPPLTEAEALTVTRIASAAGLRPPGLIRGAPFRAPHQGISAAALIGGGTGRQRPGEISLAHNGVLFLDELGEFPSTLLELLRQPLQSGTITIDRLRYRMTLPARFQLVAACNPCPCGYHGTLGRRCTCNPVELRAYRRRLSGPFLDRIDLHVKVSLLPPSTLLALPPGEPTKSVRARVLAARRLALERQGVRNSRLAGAALDRHAPLEKRDLHRLSSALDQAGLSARGLDRLRRLARTIADMAEVSRIRREHLAEALSYVGGSAREAG